MSNRQSSCHLPIQMVALLVTIVVIVMPAPGVSALPFPPSRTSTRATVSVSVTETWNGSVSTSTSQEMGTATALTGSAPETHVMSITSSSTPSYTAVQASYTYTDTPTTTKSIDLETISNTETLSSDATLSATRTPRTVTGVVTESDITLTLSATSTETLTDVASQSNSASPTPNLTLTRPSLTLSFTASQAEMANNLQWSRSLSLSTTDEETITISRSESVDAPSASVTRGTPSRTQSTTVSDDRSASSTQTLTYSLSASQTSSYSITSTITPPPTPTPSTSYVASETESLTSSQQRSVTFHSASAVATKNTFSPTSSFSNRPSRSPSNSLTPTLTNTTTPPRSPSATRTFTADATVTLTESISQVIRSKTISGSADVTASATFTESEAVTNSARTISIGTYSGTETFLASETRSLSTTVSIQPFPDGPNATYTSQHILRLSGTDWSTFLTANASADALSKQATLQDVSDSIHVSQSQIEIISVNPGSLIVYFKVTRQAWQFLSDARINELLLNHTTFRSVAALYRSAGFTDAVVALSTSAMQPMTAPQVSCGNSCVIALVAVFTPLLCVAFGAYLWFWYRSWRQRQELKSKRRVHLRRYQRRYGSEPPSWFTAEPYLPEDNNSIDNETETDTSSSISRGGVDAATVTAAAPGVDLVDSSKAPEESHVPQLRALKMPLATRGSQNRESPPHVAEDSDGSDMMSGLDNDRRAKLIESGDDVVIGAPPPTPPLTMDAIMAAEGNRRQESTANAPSLVPPSIVMVKDTAPTVGVDGFSVQSQTATMEREAHDDDSRQQDEVELTFAASTPLDQVPLLELTPFMITPSARRQLSMASGARGASSLAPSARAGSLQVEDLYALHQRAMAREQHQGAARVDMIWGSSSLPADGDNGDDTQQEPLQRDSIHYVQSWKQEVVPPQPSELVYLPMTEEERTEMSAARRITPWVEKEIRPTEYEQHTEVQHHHQQRRAEVAARIGHIAATLPEFDDDEAIHRSYEMRHAATTPAHLFKARDDATETTVVTIAEITRAEPAAGEVPVEPAVSGAGLLKQKKKKSLLTRLGKRFSNLFAASPSAVPGTINEPFHTDAATAIGPFTTHEPSGSVNASNAPEPAQPPMAIAVSVTDREPSVATSGIEDTMGVAGQKKDAANKKVTTPRKSRRKRPPVGEDDLFAIVTVAGEDGSAEVGNDEELTDRAQQVTLRGGTASHHPPEIGQMARAPSNALSGRSVSFRTPQ